MTPGEGAGGAEGNEKSGGKGKKTTKDVGGGDLMGTLKNALQNRSRAIQGEVNFWLYRWPDRRHNESYRRGQ